MEKGGGLCLNVEEYLGMQAGGSRIRKDITVPLFRNTCMMYSIRRSCRHVGRGPGQGEARSIAHRSSGVFKGRNTNDSRPN